jgi:hypothetical protein
MGDNSAQLAAGPDGTLGAIWERRVGTEDLIQRVVRFDAPTGTDCMNAAFGVDMNAMFGVPEQLLGDVCTAPLSAKSAWRILTFWGMNSSYELMPPGYVPAAPTPAEDLTAKLTSVKVVIDAGTRKSKTFTFSPPAVLRTDLTYGDYFGFPDFLPQPIAWTLPKLSPLPAGDHRVQVFWTLSAQHCDGFSDVPAFSCLPSGDVLMQSLTTTVVK